MLGVTITRKDLGVIGLAVGGIIGAGVIGRLLWPSATAWGVSAAGVISLLFVQLETFRRITAAQAGLVNDIRRDLRQDMCQMEAFVSLATVLAPEVPLPPFGGWSVTPEVGRLLVTSILERRPRLIVECGSGLSTLLCAYALRKVGRGRLVSLEHDQRFAEQTRASLAAHDLTGWAEVAHAPLVSVAIGDRAWQWYDIAALSGLDRIDLLWVDGPPGDLQAQSRYPAVPLLFDHLSPDARILLDDADRPDERAIVKRWLELSSDLRVNGETACRKGIVLERRGAPAATSRRATQGVRVGSCAR